MTNYDLDYDAILGEDNDENSAYTYTIDEEQADKALQDILVDDIRYFTAKTVDEKSIKKVLQYVFDFIIDSDIREALIDQYNEELKNYFYDDAREEYIYQRSE